MNVNSKCDGVQNRVSLVSCLSPCVSFISNRKTTPQPWLPLDRLLFCFLHFKQTPICGNVPYFRQRVQWLVEQVGRKRVWSKTAFIWAQMAQDGPINYIRRKCMPFDFRYLYFPMKTFRRFPSRPLEQRCKETAHVQPTPILCHTNYTSHI